MNSKASEQQQIQQKDVTLHDLTSQVATLTDQLGQIEKEKAEATKKAKESSVRSALTERLGNKLLGSNHVINTEMTGNLDKFEISDDGSVSFNDGVNSISIDEYSNRVIEANKTLLVSTQQSGGEGTEGDGQPGHPRPQPRAGCHRQETEQGWGTRHRMAAAPRRAGLLVQPGQPRRGSRSI